MTHEEAKARGIGPGMPAIVEKANPHVSDVHEDDDPSNMHVRAGYLMGLAARLSDDDRLMCERASRSLLRAARRQLEVKPVKT